MENTKKMNLTTKIFIALILGVVTGLILHPIKENPMVEKYLLNFIFNFLGNGFVRAIRMVVVPLVLCSLVMGSAGIEDVTKLGRIGIKTLAFYLSTTAFAVVLALVGGNIINPGKGIQLENIATTAVKTPETKPFVDILLDMIPINPIEALATGNMLQIIVFAILLGVALSLLGEKASNVKKLFEEGNSISLKLVELIMKLAPLGVYGLIAKTFTTLGYVALIPLFKYFIGVVIILFIHCLVTYQGILVLFGKYNPIKFFKGFAPTMMIGFSTASSSACLTIIFKNSSRKFWSIKNNIIFYNSIR